MPCPTGCDNNYTPESSGQIIVITTRFRAGNNYCPEVIWTWQYGLLLITTGHIFDTSPQLLCSKDYLLPASLEQIIWHNNLELKTKICLEVMKNKVYIAMSTGCDNNYMGWLTGCIMVITTRGQIFRKFFLD